MKDLDIIWDLDDDPDCNVHHISLHDLTVDEVESVLRTSDFTQTQSRSSGWPILFGWTYTGRLIAVVYEVVSKQPKSLYPITAYEVDESR